MATNAEAAAPLERPSWRADLLRAVAIAAVAVVLGLVTNALNEKPVPVLAHDGPGAPPEKAPRISPEKLASALNAGRAVIILDVRNAEPFRGGHPAEALNLPYASFAEHYQQLNLSTRLRAAEQIVLLCESERCPSADRAAKLLAQLGHTGIVVLHGGWEAYRAAGLPVER